MKFLSLQTVMIALAVIGSQLLLLAAVIVAKAFTRFSLSDFLATANLLVAIFAMIISLITMGVAVFALPNIQRALETIGLEQRQQRARGEIPGLREKRSEIAALLTALPKMIEVVEKAIEAGPNQGKLFIITDPWGHLEATARTQLAAMSRSSWREDEESGRDYEAMMMIGNELHEQITATMPTRDGAASYKRGQFNDQLDRLDMHRSAIVRRLDAQIHQRRQLLGLGSDHATLP